MSEHTPSWQRRMNEKREQEIKDRFYMAAWNVYTPVFFKKITSLLSSAKFVANKMESEGMNEREERMQSELFKMINESTVHQDPIMNNLFVFNHSFLNVQ